MTVAMIAMMTVVMIVKNWPLTLRKWRGDLKVMVQEIQRNVIKDLCRYDKATSCPYEHSRD
jgi:hypothetical protein